jgi:hypothetical protein
LDDKLALVEASIAPGASIGEVDRAADVDVSLIYNWRGRCGGMTVRRHRMSIPLVSFGSNRERPVGHKPAAGNAPSAMEAVEKSRTR